MNHPSKILLSASMSLGLLTACAQQTPHTMDMTQAIQAAKTPADHQALADRYEQAARQMQAKADEQKKVLAHYEEQAYLYGRQAEDLKAHSEALIRAYEMAAAANRNMAKAHQQTAAGTR